MIHRRVVHFTIAVIASSACFATAAYAKTQPRGYDEESLDDIAITTTTSAAPVITAPATAQRLPATTSVVNNPPPPMSKPVSNAAKSVPAKTPPAAHAATANTASMSATRATAGKNVAPLTPAAASLSVKKTPTTSTATATGKNAPQTFMKPPVSAAPSSVAPMTTAPLKAAPTATAMTTPPAWGYGGDDRVASERPRSTTDFTTIEKHHFQVETSFDYQLDKNQPAELSTYTFPTQLRYGIVDQVEARLRGTMFTYQQAQAGTATASTRGFGDFAFGSKWAALRGGGFIPSLGVLADITVPTGSDNVSNNTFVPVGKTILSWSLPGELTLDSNVGVDYPKRDAAGERTARFVYGTALHRALPMWNERLNAFLEFAGATPFASGKRGPHQFGTGLGVSINDHMQLDSFVRIGLTNNTPNWQTGLGFSWKI